MKRNVEIKIKFVSLYLTKKKDDGAEILDQIKSFHMKLFKSQCSKNLSKIENFICAITTPSLNNDQIKSLQKRFISNLFIQCNEKYVK